MCLTPAGGWTATTSSCGPLFSFNTAQMRSLISKGEAVTQGFRKIGLTKPEKSTKTEQTCGKTIFAMLLFPWKSDAAASKQRGSIHTLSSECQPPFTVHVQKIRVNWISLLCKVNWNWLSHSLSLCRMCFFYHQIVLAQRRAPVGWSNLLCFSAERHPPLRITLTMYERLNGDIAKWRNQLGV